MKSIVFNILWITLMVYIVPVALATLVWEPLIWMCVPLSVALSVTIYCIRNRK